jgi:hypothetical protein
MALTAIAAAPSSRMVLSAAERVYAAWLPHVGEVEAREQAQAFANRYHIVIDGPLTPLRVETYNPDIS